MVHQLICSTYTSVNLARLHTKIVGEKSTKLFHLILYHITRKQVEFTQWNKMWMNILLKNVPITKKEILCRTNTESWTVGLNDHQWSATLNNISVNKEQKFLKKLWYYVGGGYYKMIWFCKLSWWLKLAAVKSFYSWFFKC